jgi:uncharacterized CHY-type Zn-finger protein
VAVTHVRDLSHIQSLGQTFTLGCEHDLDHMRPFSSRTLCWQRQGDTAAMSVFKDAGHLFRFAGLFVLAFIIFLVVRHYVVPPSFGQYGHYRGAAIAEIAARPVKFAGHQACESCHTDVLDVKSKGKHAHVNCEACHGPLAKHADDPSSVTPAKLDTAVLCARCHTASAAKPKGFPQVDPAEHSNGVPCETCHQPHSPAIDGSAGPAPAAKTVAAGGAK